MGTSNRGRIYLAARYSRREELCEYRKALEDLGFCVTSRWLNGNHQVSDAGLSLEAHAAERERFALEDFTDLMLADMCLSFTEEPRGTNSRGGRHVEFGIALGTMKRCWIVGPRENVFHCIPDVKVFENWGECLSALSREIGQ